MTVLQRRTNTVLGRRLPLGVAPRFAVTSVVAWRESSPLSGVDQACHTSGKRVDAILENKKALLLCTSCTAARFEYSSIFSRNHATK